MQLKSVENGAEASVGKNRHKKNYIWKTSSVCLVWCSFLEKFRKKLSTALNYHSEKIIERYLSRQNKA